MSLVDIAKTVPITFWDYEFCQNGYDGWHDIEIKDWNITRNSIKLCESLKKDKRKLVNVAKHELGHQVYTAYLSDEQKNKFDDLSAKNNSPIDSLRPYSSKEAVEDFADTFDVSYRKDKPLRSKLFDEKQDFINELKPTLKPRFNLFDFSKK